MGANAIPPAFTFPKHLCHLAVTCA
jgi:hypothetical protein